MNAHGCLFFSMCVSSSLLVTFCLRGTSTYATTSLIRFTGFFSTGRVRCGGCWRRTRARARRGCNPVERVGSSERIFSSDQRIIAVERQADGVCRLIARQRCVSLRVTCRERRANRSARLCFALCRANERAGTVYQRERLTR